MPKVKLDLTSDESLVDRPVLRRIGHPYSDDVFSWLAGTLQIRTLPRAQRGQLDASWEAPTAISSWRPSVPLELLRYAGANRVDRIAAIRPTAVSFIPKYQIEF
jgi:hypothetical protein